MKETGVIFRTPMAAAILCGSKTMTRRIVKNVPNDFDLKALFEHNHEYIYSQCPYGKPGDLIYVRETYFDSEKYKNAPLFNPGPRFYYKADNPFIGDHKWKPSIHMPKAAARIWKQIVSIRLERLQDISEEDAIAEGIGSYFNTLFQENRYTDYIYDQSEWRCPISSYHTLWESINGPGSWEANPWVWRIEYKIISTTGRPQNIKL